MRRALIPLFSCLVACSNGAAGSGPKSAKGKADAAADDGRAEVGNADGADAAHGGATPTGKTVVISAAGAVPTIAPGDDVVVELRESSQGISPEYRYGWGDPLVEGDAVRYVEVESQPPPDDVDGGSTTLRYVFRAERAGKATIGIPVQNPGPEANADDFRVEVVVSAR